MSKEAPRSVPQSELGANPVHREFSRRPLDPEEVIQKLIDGEVRVLTVKEVSKMLRISPPTTYRTIRDGDLKALHLFDELRILQPCLVDALTLIKGPEAVPHEDMTEPPQLVERLVDNLIDGTDSLFEVREVAKMVEVSAPTIYRTIYNGDLAAIRFGKTFRIPRSYLHDWLIGQLTPAVAEHDLPNPDLGSTDIYASPSQ